MWNVAEGHGRLGKVVGEGGGCCGRWQKVVVEGFWKGVRCCGCGCGWTRKVVEGNGRL